MNFLTILPRFLIWPLCGSLLCLLGALAEINPASAAEAPRAAWVGAETTPPLAAWYAELGRRDRVVQLCVITGAFALFVIMKKMAR